METNNHTPEPWTIGSHNSIWGNFLLIAQGSTEYNAKRIVECVNACEGQSIEDVKLATAHKNACLEWERLMIDIVGEDGPRSVSEAVLKLKEEREKFRKGFDAAQAVLTKAMEQRNELLAALIEARSEIKSIVSSAYCQVPADEQVMEIINNTIEKAKGGQ